MKRLLLIIMVLLPVLLASCVTTGTYERALFERDSVRMWGDSLQNVIERNNREINDLEAQINNHKAEISSLKNELAELQKSYAALKSMSSTELQSYFDRVNDLQSKLAEKDRLINIYNSKLKARDEKLEKIKNSLNNALNKFTGKGLTVELKNGKIYVSLSNKLLFATGSTEIDKEGKNALKELSSILNAENEINVLVEGHTDTQKVRGGGRYEDNWDLSVLRATEVIRFLTIDGKVDPEKITASGRGEFYPVKEGDDPESLASNRRTEIIIIPSVTEVLELIED